MNSKTRKAVYDAFEGRCFYTGKLVSLDDMHVDHLIPTDAGGSDTIDNYVLTSSRINLLKSNRVDVDLIDKMVYIVRTAYAPKVRRLLRDKHSGRTAKKKRSYLPEQLQDAWFSLPLNTCKYCCGVAECIISDIKYFTEDVLVDDVIYKSTTCQDYWVCACVNNLCAAQTDEYLCEPDAVAAWNMGIVFKIPERGLRYED